MKLLVCLITMAAAGCSRNPPLAPLIPASATMVRAWEVPNNPLTDSSLDSSANGADIRRGYRLFVNTPAEAARLVPGRMSCGNCHLNAGQRERALPLVGVATVFPDYNKRAGRSITLADRVVDCFQRSENATASGATPAADSPEVRALSAYLTWLARGAVAGQPIPWRGQNTIAAASIIPIDRLKPADGAQLYADRCVPCHREDGQGAQIGDKRAAPLWGDASWNDGAGAARIYTLAGIIRYTMPYLNPGSLTDAEAQQIAAYITSKPRPVYPFKDRDYRTSPVPSDAVYYRPR